MDSPLELDFRMDGAGWAELHIRKGDRRHEIGGISYLSDALDDLVRLGIAIATDRSFAWAQFFHEPQSTILFAEHGWLDEGWQTIGTRLSAAPWGEYGEHEPSWKLLADAEREFMLELDSRDELPEAILAAADRVEKELGIDGYSRQWTGRLGFPTRAVAALRAALATPPVATESWNG